MKKRSFFQIAGFISLALLTTFSFLACPNETPAPNTEPELNLDALRGTLLILQAYGPSDNNAQAASHSFVELYNNTGETVNLDGFTLWFANGWDSDDDKDNPDYSATTDKAWKVIPLDGYTINKGCSFLILGKKSAASGGAGTNHASRLQFNENNASERDIYDSTLDLSNRAFKVALIYSEDEISVQNPFTGDGEGMIEGYIDMVGARNRTQSSINGYETVPTRNSASETVRRKDFTDTDNNSTDFVSARYANDGFTNDEVEARRPRTNSAGAWDPFMVTEEQDQPSQLPSNTLLIFQVGAATDGALSHNFVELYNAGDEEVNLAGYSLQYADGTAASATEDSAWSKIDLNGKIPAGQSFLILGAAASVTPVIGTAPNETQYIIPDNSGDINDAAFVISNRAFKVALMSNTTLLTVQNPYSAQSDGYVDMLGANNNDTIRGYETAPCSKMSKQQSARRISLTDTDNNNNDFTNVDYRGNAAPVDFRTPKNLAYGVWDPITDPNPPEPPDPGDNTLLIFQAGAATDGALSHNFVELYNAGDEEIDLAGYSLQYADGAAVSETADGAWSKIDLNGKIPAGHSFLILGAPASVMPVIGTTSNTTQYIIPGNSGDINDAAFVISNRAFKVVLMSNTTLLTEQNPFDINGAGTKAAGYVDMLGANNNDVIRGYETAPCSKMSKQQSARRTSLKDTDNNNSDFTNVDYRGNAAALGFRTPKNLAYGTWNPLTGE